MKRLVRARRAGLCAAAATWVLIAASAHAQSAEPVQPPVPPVVEQPVPAQATPTVPSTPAEAPSATDPDAGIPDVVVTAQFRGQALQKTPVAITAVDSAMIESRGLLNIADVGGSVPNMTIKPGGSAYGPAAQVYIRGVGQYDSNFAQEPGVGVYVDDVYQGTLLGTLFELVDLDRIEVLRGPQGTLAGKNSIGGALKLFSKKPDDSNDGYASMTLGSFNRFDVKAGVDVTLVPDKLFMRVSGLFRRRDGYLDRLDYGCLHPGSGVPSYATSKSCKLGTQGGQNTAAGRAAMRWVASDDVEVNVTGDVTRDHSEVAPTKLIATSNPLLTGKPGVSFITGPRSYTNYSTYIDPGTRFNSTTNARAFPGDNNVDSWGLAATIDWKLGGSTTLKSITAYRQFTGAFLQDFNGAPYDVQIIYNTFRFRQFTQELRLSGSSFGERLDWTVGAFYYKAHGDFGGEKIQGPTTPTATIYTVDDSIPSDSIAGYAHGVFNIVGGLSAVGGIRYTSESKDYTFGRRDPDDPTQLPKVGSTGALDGVRSHYKGSNWDYRAGLQYQATPTLLTYAEFSTGFKGGGENPRPVDASQAVPFDPEKLDAYEVGAKSTLFHRMLRINAAAFINKYDSIILTITNPAPRQVPTNAGKATIKGAELEFEARPVTGLELDGSVSYLHFRYTDLLPRVITSGVTYASVNPFTPTWKWNVGAQYRAELGRFGSLTPRVDANYQSSVFTNAANSPLGKVAPYTVANAQLAWQDPADVWRVSLNVTNLTDNFYYQNKFTVGTPFNFTVGTPGRPREWSVTLNRKF